MKVPPVEYRLQSIPVPMPFQSNDVYMYLYDGAGTLTLFDAAFPNDDAWEALLGALAKWGRRVRDIGRIILTHHHFDHTGLVGRLADETDAELCGHPDIPLQAGLTYTYDEAHNVWMRELLGGFGVPQNLTDQIVERRPVIKPLVCRVDRLDRPLDDGAVIDGFRVCHVPGHSPTDTLYVHEKEGFSITGDHILEHITPNPILRRPPAGQPRAQSLVQYEQSLQRSRALALGRCFPGHGKPFPDHHPVVDRIRAQHEKRNQRILPWLPATGATPYETALHLYPRMGVDILYFCTAVAVGQLELLESQGLAVSSTEEGVLKYFPVAAHEPERDLAV